MDLFEFLKRPGGEALQFRRELSAATSKEPGKT
jgi:hypothetical protein